MKKEIEKAKKEGLLSFKASDIAQKRLAIQLDKLEEKHIEKTKKEIKELLNKGNIAIPILLQQFL